METPVQTVTAEARLLDSLLKIGRLTANTEVPGEALKLVLQEVMALLPASGTYIALLNPDTGLFEMEVTTGCLQAVVEAPRHGLGVAGWSALHAKPLLIPDLNREPKFQVWTGPDAGCAIAVPLEERGFVSGVLYIEGREPNAFNADHLRAAELLTQQSALVVNRLWLHNQLKDKSHQVNGLVRAGQQIAGQHAIDAILRALTAEARAITGSRICALFMLSAEEDLLNLNVMDGAEPHAEDEAFIRLEESALATTISHRKQIEVLDMRRIEEHHFTKLAQEIQLTSFLASPLLAEGEVIGVLISYSDHPHRFSNDERQILAALASLGAVAIQNSRLYARVLSSEESLRRNERLTTLGLLSAEIAHEIRNPLTVLRLLFESLDLQFPDQDARNQDVKIIGEKLSQLEEIVTRVLNFGKSSEALHSRWDLQKLVADTLQLVRFKLSQVRIATKFSSPAQPLLIEGSKGQLQQAFLNLIINASEAMPSGGQLDINLCQEYNGTQPIVALYFKDTGRGIPEKIRPHIFDSFLTGRADGTGLGLGIVQRILADHHGNIEVHETSPEGTTMRAWLPLVESRR
ncbi:MAG: GAF domain-containing protein [Verrucomicrobiota bacterium]|nr:GAF domain-containing protein [Verrucomicrobiota bacterium]